MIPLVIKREETGEIPWLEYEGRDFFKLFAGAASPIGEEPGAIVVIGETFEKVPGMGRLTLEPLFENPRAQLEDFSQEWLEKFKRSYCLKEIWGDPRNGSNLSEIPRVYRDKVNAMGEVVSFIESILTRKILRLDDKQTGLPEQLRRLKSAQGSLNRYPLLAAWFYALAVADVHQTATYEEPGPSRFVQRYAIKDYDEFR